MSNELEKELLLGDTPESSVSTRNYIAGTSKQARMSKAVSTALPSSPDHLPSMLYYDIIGGVPVRKIKADKRICRTTLSEDGRFFAVGDLSGQIKLRRTTDYISVGIAENICPIDMHFVKGESDTLRVVTSGDESSVIVIDVEIEQDQTIHYPNKREREWYTLSRIKHEIYLDLPSPVVMTDFSDDGNTLIIRAGSAVFLYRFNDGHVIEREFCPESIETSHEGYSMISADGQRLFSVLREVMSESGDSREIIAVWPRLQLDVEATPKLAIIQGYRALWIASGEFLGVWDDESEFPRLHVYKTEDLANDNYCPIDSHSLSPELVHWEAISSKDANHALLIREDYKSGNLRFLQWDVKENKLKEICLTRPTDRYSERMDSGTDPRGSSTLDMPYQLDSLESANSDSLDSRYPSLNLDGGDARQSESMYDLRPSFCIDADGRWIGSFSKRGDSVILLSPRSGAVAFNCQLPEGTLSNLWPAVITFDPCGRHLLIISRDSVLIFAPPMLQCPQPEHISTIGVPYKVLWDDKDDKRLQEAFQVLGSGALTTLCNEWQFSSQLYDDVFSPSRRFQKMALSSNGKWCAWTAWRVGIQLEHVAGIMYAVSPDGQKKITLDRLPLDGFHSTSVFVSPTVDDKDLVVCLDVGSKPLQLLEFGKDRLRWDVTRQKQLDIDSCLHVSQTRNRQSLVIVEERSVCLVDLDKLDIRPRIPYRTDFKELFKQLKDQFPVEDARALMERRIVSDDGQTVLLGWDVRIRQSILVTPTTELYESEEAMKNAGDGLSPFCQLIGNGACTLFVDLDALSKGRLLIDERVRNSVCVVEDVPNVDRIAGGREILLNHFFYEMTEDASEIIALTLPYEDLKEEGFFFVKDLKKFNIYATEECIPDYIRFVRSRRTTATEKVKDLSKRFNSGTVFNHPVSDNKSIFQQAYLDGNHEIVESVKELAHQQNIKLAAQWLPSTLKEAESVEEAANAEDLLMHSLETKALAKAEEAIDFLMSNACSHQDAARVWGQNFAEALRLNPRRIIKALLQDEFIVELCELEVNATFLDSIKRRDTALHINTLEELQPWTLEKDPMKLGRMWRAKNPIIIEAMEKEGNVSRVMATLKVVCVEGADLPGHQGLIRHLLLQRVQENVFKSRAVKWIVSRKWFTIWRRKFLQKTYWYVAFLVCLTAYAMVLGRIADMNDTLVKFQVASTLILPLLWVYGILMTIEETKQITLLMNEGKKAKRSKWWGVRYYFDSKWNWVDAASCLLLVVLIPIFHFFSFFIVECNSLLSGAVAVEVLLAYIKVWYFAQPFRVTGALVLMIDRIIRDCLAFLLLTLIVLLGFALAIHVMSRGITNAYKQKLKEEHRILESAGNIINTETREAEDPSAHSKSVDNEECDSQVKKSFGTFRSSILTLFYALFGEFEPDVFSTEHALSWMILTTFVTYMITQIVVMLNLLISIMGDTFDRVKSNEEGQMLMARAMIIDSCEASASKEEVEEMNKKTGTYVCALEGIGRSSHDVTLGSWPGRMNMLVENFREIISKGEAALKSLFGKAMETSSKEIKAVIEAVKAQGTELTKATEATMNMKTQVTDVGRVVDIIQRETKQEVNAVKEITEATKKEMKEQVATLMTSINERDLRIDAINDRLQHHATQQASALASLEARMEQNSQDVSAKLERLLSVLENLSTA